jgi:peptidoglycan/LPS O-acetylase OafA/YrhL
MYSFSERLAWVAAFLIPAAETARRWGTWWDFPPAYLDDVLIGVFFVVGALASRYWQEAGPRWLAASYGFACGIGFLSLATNIVYIDRPDPTGASGLTAVAVKAGMMALGVVGLAGALRGRPAIPIRNQSGLATTGR